MTSSEDIFLQFDSPDGELAVLVEGDERVSYAYLLRFRSEVPAARAGYQPRPLMA